MTRRSSNRCTAVIGLAKHAGKTTALNRLIEELSEGRSRLGLCSIGFDGEPVDSLHGIDKPPVLCRAGDLIVSARQALERSTCDVDYRISLGERTPIGTVYLARTLTPGRVMLAGIRSRDVLEVAVRQLHLAGVDSVLVDGALGRVMTAGASTTDSVVLAVGAGSGSTPSGVAEAAKPMVEQLLVPELPGGVDAEPEPGSVLNGVWRRQLLHRAVDTNRVALGRPGEVPTLLEAGSSLLALRRATELLADGVYGVAVSGAVTDGVVDELISTATPSDDLGSRRPWLLVPDISSLTLDAASWRRLRAEWRLAVGRRVLLDAVAINPRRPDGTTMDVEAMRRAIKLMMVDLDMRPAPVWDPRTSDVVSFARIGTNAAVLDNDLDASTV